MPKIPTFTARGRPTAEAAGVVSDIKIPLNQTVSSALSPLGEAAEDYYIKQRNLEEKTEANKKFFEIQNKVEESQEKVKYDFNQDNAINTFNTDFNNEKNKILSQTSNKRVKQLLESKLNIEYPEYLLTVKRNSRDALQVENISTHNSLQQTLMSKHYLASGKQKDIIKNQLINNEIDFSNNWNTGKTKLDESVNAIKSDLFITDVEKDISNKNFGTALSLLKDVKSSKFLNTDKRIELIEKVQTEFDKELSITNIDNILDNKLGVYAVGAQLKNIDESIITKKNLEEGMNKKAQNRINTPAQVIELSISNGAAVPLYKSIINGGSANISDTGNKQLTKQGLEYYKLFKTQNGFNSLKSTYKIDKETLASYARMDFATNYLKETFDSAFAREVDIKNKPESYKLRTVDDIKVDATFSNIDMPGFFLGDIQNAQTTKYILKNIANIYYKAGGNQDSALDGARQFVEQNYRMDLFQQIVPIDNSLPEYHDAAIKTYIKKIYDEGRINKETNKLDDIIPVYYSLGGLSDVQGIILKNRTNDQTISIGGSIPFGDFDEVAYDSARLTQKDIVEKIYPLQKDKRFAGNVKKYNLLQDKRKRMFELTQPFVESGFGQPVE
tara:strand:- start:394 stop:2235 length:1842 start_codon:yes stop_codon:yes gene_type:complete